MEKNILEQYMDACELVKETQQDIKRLKQKRQTIVQTVVSGSNPEFPYQPQHFGIAGTAFTYSDDSQLRMEEKLLQERIENAKKVKMQAEMYINLAPPRMQRIIRFRVMQHLTWEEVANRMKGKCTAESIKKEYQRFLEKK